MVCGGQHLLSMQHSGLFLVCSLTRILLVNTMILPDSEQLSIISSLKKIQIIVIALCALHRLCPRIATWLRRVSTLHGQAVRTTVTFPFRSSTICEVPSSEWPLNRFLGPELSELSSHAVSNTVFGPRQ